MGSIENMYQNLHESKAYDKYKDEFYSTFGSNIGIFDNENLRVTFA